MLTGHMFDEALKGPGPKTTRCAIQNINNTNLVVRIDQHCLRWTNVTLLDLQLVEVSGDEEKQVLSDKKTLDMKCDVACLLYQHGNSDSFNHFDAVFEELFDKSVSVALIPVITYVLNRIGPN